MGCTGGKTYEEAVREEMKRYLHSLKLTSLQEKEIKRYINQDLTKRALALKNYQYIYRDEDAKQTAEDYKKMIMEKYHIGQSIYEQALIKQEEKNQENKEIVNKNNNNVNSINNII